MTDQYGVHHGGLQLVGSASRSNHKGKMTIIEVMQKVSPHKACSLQSMRRYFRTLNIKPVGCRQKPQQYPDTAVKLVLEHLGHGETNGIEQPTSARIVSMRKLKATREKARTGK